MENSRDCSRWAKKFDEVAHLYDNDGGVLCGSVSACLGNNYATKEMETCKTCEEMLILNDSIKPKWVLGTHDEDKERYVPYFKVTPPNGRSVEFSYQAIEYCKDKAHFERVKGQAHDNAFLFCHAEECRQALELAYDILVKGNYPTSGDDERLKQIQQAVNYKSHHPYISKS